MLDMSMPISRTFSTAVQRLNLSISMILFWNRRKIFRGRNSTLSRSKLFIPNFHSLKLHWKKLLDNLKHLHQNIPHQNQKEETVLLLELNVSIKVTLSSTGQLHKCFPSRVSLALASLREACFWIT